MRIIKLMPKANEDLEGIWYYSYHHFGEPQADRYVEHLSDVLQILSNNNIGTVSYTHLTLPTKRIV